jgi:hypothetical protein
LGGGKDLPMSPEHEMERKKRKVIPKEIVENVFSSAMPSLRYELSVWSDGFGVIIMMVEFLLVL